MVRPVLVTSVSTSSLDSLFEEEEEPPAKQSRVLQFLAQVFGIALLLPTLIFVLGFTTFRWKFADSCDGGDADSTALFDYMSFWICTEALPLPARVVFLLVWLILLISLLASTADNFFVPQLEEMAYRLSLAEDVAGVTLLALGNGMPDIMTARSSITKANDFSLTMGEFLGAAGFIIGFVLGCVLLTKMSPTKVYARSFLRDSTSYAVVLVFMVAVTWDEYITLLESLSFFVIYIVYVLIVVLPHRFRRLRSPTRPAQAWGQSNARPLLQAEVEARGLQENSLAQRPNDARDNVSQPQLVAFLLSVVNQAACVFQRVSSFVAMYFVLLAKVFPSQLTRQSRSIKKVPEPVREYSDPEERFQEQLLHQESSLDSLLHQESSLDSDTEEAENNEDVLEGFGSAENTPLEWFQLVMELPFTVARHVSIPSADWSPKRRRLAAVCPFFSSLVMILSFGGFGAFTSNVGPLPVWLWSLIVGAIGFLSIMLGSSPDQKPWWHSLLLFLAFLCTVAWFNLFANECVAVLETFGLKVGISSSVLGITVLAWGNSVGDLVADTALVRKGKSKMAVSGCFGSPMTSDLLGLGIALTSYTLANGPLKASLSTQNKIAAGFTLLVILICMITFSCNPVDRGQLCASRWLGRALVAGYAAFMVVSVLAELGYLYPKD